MEKKAHGAEAGDDPVMLANSIAHVDFGRLQAMQRADPVVVGGVGFHQLRLECCLGLLLLGKIIRLEETFFLMLVVLCVAL